jgi:hypothetical protein
MLQYITQHLCVLEVLGHSINATTRTYRLADETGVRLQQFGAKFLEKVRRLVVPEGKSTALPNPN